MGLDGSVQLFDMTVRKYDVEKADRFIPNSSFPVSSTILTIHHENMPI